MAIEMKGHQPHSKYNTTRKKITTMEFSVRSSAIWGLLALAPGAQGFLTAPPMHQSSKTLLAASDLNEADTFTTEMRRDSFLSQVLTMTVTSAAVGSVLNPHSAQAADSDEATVFQLPSGVKYLDLQPGTGPTPEYGQLVTIAYKGFIKLPPNKDDPNPKPQQFDSASSYLHKHGSGRLIAGLDEGLHTLKEGGTRRIIIPPKLGYVTSGIGPIPEYPWDRSKLNNLLDKMIALRGGTVVFEVTLMQVRDDEADQGYYKDESLSPQEFEILRNNIQQRAKET